MFNSLKKYHIRLRVFASLTLIMLCAAGCLSTVKAPTLVVGNATESLISHVALTTESGQIYSFKDIPPHSVSSGSTRISALTPEIRVEWKFLPDGSNSLDISISEHIQDFNGWIQFQIDSKGAVKVFTAPMDDAEGSVLPWSMPASWEGAPSIPGMNM